MNQQAVQDEETRYRLVQEQAGRPFQESRAPLFAALGDESWRVRKQAVEILLSMRPATDALHDLIELLRDEENAGLRNAAAELLVRLGERAVEVLLSHLDDPDHDLRKQVVDVLGVIGGKEAQAGLIHALTDTDVNVAAAAAEGLGHGGDAAAVPALLNSLQQNEDLFFRFNVLTALSLIGMAGPLPAIIHQLAGQQMLQRPLYACLGRIGNDLEAAEFLLAGVVAPQTGIRQVALCSLGQVLHRLDPAQAQQLDTRLQGLAAQGLLDILHEAFMPGNRELNEAIIDLLGRLADPASAEVLLCALMDEYLAPRARTVLKAIGKRAIDAAVARFDTCGDPAERAVLCAFLGWLGDELGAATLIKGVQDDMPRVRAAAASAAAGLEDTCLHGSLINLLEDDDVMVRAAALATLRCSALVDAGQISQAASRMAQAPEPAQRRGAAQLFADFGDGAGLSCLLNDEDASVREAAARAAGRLGRDTGCSHLVTALVDEDPDVRIAAAEALAECGNLQAIAPLRLALKDPDAWVQAAVLRSLVRLAGCDAVPDLMQCWEQGDEVVQLACLEVAEQVISPDLLRVFSRGLGSRDGEVLKGAISLLCHHDISLLLPWLQHILCHEDWDVRMAAVRVCALLPLEEAALQLQMVLDREENDLVREEIRLALRRE